MAQTTQILPGLKKIIRAILHFPFLTNLLKKIVTIGVSGLAFLRHWRFPAKFDWDWKLEMIWGKYEPETTALFNKIITPGMTVVDIGAHIGYYTRLFAKQTGGAGKVYAFEADPENSAFLKHNTAQFPNIIIIAEALSDKVGTVTFYHVQNSTGCHSIVAQENATTLTVPTNTLDALLASGVIQRPDIIKIDIEGGEPLAFQGMAQLLKDQKPLSIVMEFNPSALEAGDQNPLMFLSQMSEYGFTAFGIQTNGELSPLNIGALPESSWYKKGSVNVLLRR